MRTRIIIAAAVASLGGGLSILNAQMVGGDPQGLDTPLSAQNAYGHTAVLNAATVYNKDEAAARTVNTHADGADASHLQYFDNLLSSPALGMNGVAQDAPVSIDSLDLTPAALDLRGAAGARVADAAGGGAGGGGGSGGGAGDNSSGTADGTNGGGASAQASANGTFHAAASTTPSDGNGSFLDLHATVPTGDTFPTGGGVNLNANQPLSFNSNASVTDDTPASLSLASNSTTNVTPHAALQPSNPHPLTETLENTTSLDTTSREAAGASLSSDPPATLSSVPEPGATALIAATLLLFTASTRLRRRSPL